MLVVNMRLFFLNLFNLLRYMLHTVNPVPQPLTSPIQAFIDVLKDRFKDVGLHKIEAGEFALEDSRLKRSLQLTKPWAAIVRPGQQINMSMVFRLKETPTARCPGCYKENAGSDLEDIEWYMLSPQT